MASREELKQRFVAGAVPSQEDFHALIDTVGQKGAKGDPGEDGADGAQGPKGEPGADGFGTEEQYNEIIARLNELEGPAE